MGRLALAVAVCVVVSGVLAGCSSPRCKQRGWVGGDVKTVKACPGLFEAPAPACDAKRVVGMPAGAGADHGLLVTHAGPGTPLASAGLREGDLILALDGAAVGDPLVFRRVIEAKAPGSTVMLDLWRDGARERHEVRVGRETYQHVTTLGIGLFLSPQADLWPFDGSFNVFGLVAVTSDPRRRDLDSPERAYLAKAVPGKVPAPPQQESLSVHLFPFMVGGHNVVKSQEPVLVARR